jgi:hypothetical protein
MDVYNQIDIENEEYIRRIFSILKNVAKHQTKIDKSILNRSIKTVLSLYERFLELEKNEKAEQEKIKEAKKQKLKEEAEKRKTHRDRSNLLISAAKMYSIAKKIRTKGRSQKFGGLTRKIKPKKYVGGGQELRTWITNLIMILLLFCLSTLECARIYSQETNIYNMFLFEGNMNADGRCAILTGFLAGYFENLDPAKYDILDEESTKKKSKLLFKNYRELFKKVLIRTPEELMMPASITPAKYPNGKPITNPFGLSGVMQISSSSSK